MKRIFINRVLAFLLIGATLTYAGCKDYDDDINDLQKQIDEKNERYLYLLELQEQIDNQ